MSVAKRVSEEMEVRAIRLRILGNVSIDPFLAIV